MRLLFLVSCDESFFILIQVKKFLKNLPPPPFPAQWESEATPSPAPGQSQQLPAAQARPASGVLATGTKDSGEVKAGR